MKRSSFIMLLFAIAVALSPNASAAENRLDLAGVWQVTLDGDDRGLDERWFAATLHGDDEAELPGALRESELGARPSSETQWIGGIKEDEWSKARYAPYRSDDNFKMPFWLQPNRHYVGPAWFQRSVNVPEDWRGQRITLRLERPHWHTTLWIDDQPIGACDSLSTPHVYDVTDAVMPGRHRVTIRVDNSLAPLNVGPNAHSVSDHTQSAWNGIVGRMELCASPPVWLEDIQVYPDIEKKAARIAVQIGNRTGEDVSATLALRVHPLPVTVPQALPAGTAETGDLPDVARATRRIEVPAGEGQQTIDVTLGQAVLLWDEFVPHRYVLAATLESTHGKDRRAETFGMRNVTTRGTQIVVNSRPVSLRGTLECCIFPLTGYPPTDVESWKRVIRVCQSYGLNHMRFHSWCPPEAAFEAADELGFYFQVECSTWPNQGASIGVGGPIDEWLYREADRIVAEYGNHPSFLLLASGNEPSGPGRGAKFLGPWVKHYREKDTRRLVTSASGWPLIRESSYHVAPQPRIQGWGQGLRSRINAQAPETLTDYRDFVAQYPDQPVVSHEIGQWCVYPNFDEMPKYAGSLQPRNFEVFRDFLTSAGMLDQAADFLMASGKLQTLCYKEEIESALRTPGFGGFQLLDLHDFPGQGTALVGVVDPFWDPKPYVAPKEVTRFCSATVLLARLSKRVFTTDETLTAALEISHFGPTDLANAVIVWSVSDDQGQQIASDRFTVEIVRTGQLSPLREISVPMIDVRSPCKLKLSVRIEGTAAENDWEVWSYPAEVPTAAPDNVRIARFLDDEAVRVLGEGGNVLLLVEPNRIKTDVALGFSSVFWNTAWTGGQAPHTLGILCDAQHPALALFPTEYHSNWQWWELVHSAATMEMDQLPAELRPLVQVVPDWFAPQRLGLAFEARVAGGKLLVCSMDLSNDLDRRPVARQMRHSLLDYMTGGDFRPKCTLDVSQVQALLKPPSTMQRLGAKATADSYEMGYEPECAIDGNPQTMWHTAWTPSKAPLPHSLVIELRQMAKIAGIRVLPRQDNNPNGQIARYAVHTSVDGKSWGPPVAAGTWKAGSASKDIRFAQPVETQFLKLGALSEMRGAAYASAAELELILAQ